MVNDELVLVVDASRQFVEYVSPAVARKALKDGLVTLFRKQPFSVKLPPGVTRCPRPVGRARREAMQSQRTNNFTEFFKEERDVWVKTLISGQVSIEFEVNSGHNIGICIPYTGDPFCLTDRVPFEAIKRSTQLRTLCGPRRSPRTGEVKPPALALLTAEQAYELRAQKASRKGLWLKDHLGNFITDDDGHKVPDVDAVDMLVNTAALPPQVIVTPPDEDMGEKKPLVMRIADVVNPRVMYLCAQVGDHLAENERITADALLIELEAIEQDLKVKDFEYIRNNGFFKTIKAWADERVGAAQGE